jgi:putative membrane protein
MKNWSNIISIALKGMAMGMAEVIPGVSGGTIAFITGIYEKLLESIKNILGPEAWRSWRSEGFKAAWQNINGTFLVFLLTGMAVGIVIGVFGITYLLETYPVLLWAFFFGLIIGSAIYIGRQIPKWGMIEIIAVIAGTIIAYLITIASPAEGSDSYLMVFIAGAIAISALILPGISGSFMLLLMGMYTIIIPTVKEALKTLAPDKLATLFVLGMGCLLGLATFSRLLSWTFKHYRTPTLAVLTGFMIGSLNKIWPWRKPVLGIDETGKLVNIEAGVQIEKVIKEINLLPAQYQLEVGANFLVPSILAMIAGLLIVFLLEYLGREKS